MTQHLWLANSGVSYTSTGEELPEQEILQAGGTALTDTSREESSHSLLQKVQNEKKQSNQLVSAEAFWCQLRSREWSKMFISS